MGKRGRLGKKKQDIEITYDNQCAADIFIKCIGEVYEEYRIKYNKYHYNEELLNNTILLCYESIQRNGLKDTSKQGCKNYLFRSFNMNLKQVSAYETRKNEVDSDTIIELFNNEFGDTVDDNNKIIKQIRDDFRIIYISKYVEKNYDKDEYYLWRMKNFINGMTYQKLRDTTNVKNCKKIITDINKAIKRDITIQVIDEAFDEFLNNNNILI